MRLIAPGRRLDDFLDVLQRSESESVFVPTRAWRQLSPNNPYVLPPEHNEHGFYYEVQPASLALRLIACRETLTDTWIDQLSDLSTGRPLSGPSRAGVASPTAGDGRGDVQLLRGIATKLAVHEMLRDMALLPSQVHVHEWLAAYLLVEHKEDLTITGSVERLLCDLGSQPIHIRGGSLVDPLTVVDELVERTATNIDKMAVDLAASREAHVGSNFLESCFNL